MGKSRGKGLSGNGRRMGRSTNKSRRSQHNSKSISNLKSEMPYHDQVHENLKSGVKLKFDEDLPGCGQHYCVPCAKHFIDAKGLVTHSKSKLHKRLLKDMMLKPHTQEDAELFAGLQTDKSYFKKKDGEDVKMEE
eukprot:GHVH01007134.1.p1 GENE.GHVH01007134.1~~GHVH01007134.1.p1  ORF type:complete len:151 (+),score=26.27 GHVH01007134.1:49-453(+)